ncbi:MAG: acetyl-CoA C-acyltransferase [Cytophagales bacterium]|nr:acetyl-CoA C-acyltransferase [Cytophagales bacterium]MCA6366845.1 acetyl-CoA C-acyltransferase [Cytophagales bacterium]MCA6370901.1 acetyl-CoA C-acyltransferase [Cytophagales bacterium]MCA6375318.1 acetyl-CoA C-acyltransferase [Cytophagales bacterium]MCA6382019.1 acetyl-CoA C-acyltransferase [Cytophagales bacterium]
MKTAYIIDILRTPIGKYAGTLASVRPDDLAAHVIKKLIERNPAINTAEIEDVIFGAANQAGEDNRDVARMALLLAGLPTSVGGVTVNRLCASGLQAVMDASRGIVNSDGSIYIAGGVESMSRAPFVMGKSEEAFSRKPEIFDTTIGWRFVNSKLSKLYHPYSMGETAENVAEKWKITREQQDTFALASQQKYATAALAKKFDKELAPIFIAKGKETIEFSKDEYPRETTSLEKLAQLKPAFKEGGSVTAGNSSGINDGAAACLITNEEVVNRLNLKPLARIVSMAIAGVDPAYMGVGPVPATQKALQRAGLKISDIGLIELNEAFASQSLACINDLELNPEIVNVNGGAIAIGHPLGCSGVRISTTLIHEMQKRKVKYGLATMCIGVGQGAAIIYELV